ncbi:excinuclease ABC subunit UvrA [Campylobacter californiensis]|uniref:ATP-binding cassette domain-containing protein n=1 Tax=Campylobacter californiensis TaxID=1032243 RepID=UPI002AD276FA|nr:ATP-binding cassette domain-containing protein [Campylobacter sp. RM12916]
MDQIEIKNAHENNLKNIDINIPKSKLVLFAGVSGCGKSSLVYDTIAVESAREWQSTYPLYIQNKMSHFERPKVGSIKNLTPVIVVDQRPLGTGARSTVGTAINVSPLLRLLFSRVASPSAGGSMAYSFNHPLGMCPACSGLGKRLKLNESKLFDMDKTLKEGAILFSEFSAGWQTHLYQSNPLLDANKKLKEFSKSELDMLMYGSDADIKVEIRSNNTGRVDRVAYEGVVPRFNRLYLNRDISKLKKSLQDEISALISEQVCDECGGIGLNKNALASRINGLNIAELSRLNANELLRELGRIDDPVGSALSRQICEKLERMIAVGIGYLSLDRRSDTLSGGEAQMVKMVRNLGSSLSNITYIFDEPTAGLHPHDASKIGQILLNLRDNHNNILVIEHNTQMIKLADHIVELGEFGGSGGGRIIYEGDLAGLQKRDSKTAKALNEGVQINQNPLKFSEVFAIKNATRNNLKNVSVDIPKGILVAISGVAGSGKSSLMDEFMAHYPQAIKIDQKAIGAQNRSTPATYTGVMDEIRKLFAKANGVDAGWFSPNSKGACKACKGSGVISYDMAFAGACRAYVRGVRR